MDKKSVTQFFDHYAPDWDRNMVRNDGIIDRILDNAGVKAGMRVLDVACGTGVLFPDYLARDVKSVLGIDISPVMVEIAEKKIADEPKIHVCLKDAENCSFDQCFDCIVIYNAFPHFPDPNLLVSNLTKYLAPGGILSVAHGMSRENIDRHHSIGASTVSVGLMPELVLAELLSKYLEVCVVISDDEMYQVAGKKIIF
jgi:demethylmenaquinone methyltransferase/2-methoxy-6-polyprenyl-1,4-benzoquinol methylase